jgi:hypothetical protein
MRFHLCLPAFLIAFCLRVRCRYEGAQYATTSRCHARPFGGFGRHSIAVAQIAKDPPWNPDHIDHLPPEVRSVVLAMCAKSPSAGHYFPTCSQNSRQINLHFEKFHCEQGPAFCTAVGCLHQLYALAAGRYHSREELLRKRQRLISRPGKKTAQHSLSVTGTTARPAIQSESYTAG